MTSVYGIYKITNHGDVLYSGDTFIRIRSGLHDRQNAHTHAFDVRDIFQWKLVKRRPILLMEMDSAQDETPCFPKTLATTVDLFHSLDLDGLLHEMNAAGFSAFNSVECRMASLSHDLPGIVLPYDHFGNYLDSSGEKIDHEMEEKNFQKAAEVFSKV